MHGEDHGPLLTTDQLPQPFRGMYELLSAHEGHPSRTWFEKFGNGVFEDDNTVGGLPAPHPIYRFRRGDTTAYVWEIGGTWFVRPWRRMRGCTQTGVLQVVDFKSALDELTRRPRPWWRLWA